MAIFKEVYQTLELRRPGRAVSVRGTKYRMEARTGEKVAIPRSGRVTIQSDCWLEAMTCQGTRVGGIYNGPQSFSTGIQRLRNAR